MKGPDFIALHKLFDEINEEVEEYVDLTAERVVQLGGVAEGTARLAVKASKLPEYPGDHREGRQHVDALSTALATYGKLARARHRRGEQARRRGHRGHLHRDLPRGGQVAVVRRGAPAVEPLTLVVVWVRPWRCPR